MSEERTIGAFEIVIVLILAYLFLSQLFPPLAVVFSSESTVVSYVFYYLYKAILVVLPIAGMIALIYYANFFWLHYVQARFISGITWVLLEIVPPRDVIRSPKAMELFLTNALYHWSEKSGLETYWQGAVWFWFSLEIASIEGQVHFYINTPSRLKELIEVQLYSQYPQAQVKEVRDYTLAVDKITPEGNWSLWGCEFTYSRPDAFPLRTYIDFGLDDDPKEELKIDPISPVVELFSTMGKGEQMWSQIVVTPAKKKFRTGEKWFKYHDWVKESELTIRSALAEFTGSRSKAPGDPSAGGYAKEIRAPSFLDEASKKASSKMQKVGFETGIRVCYVAKKEVFDMGHRRNLRLIWRQYAAPNLNELRRINSTQADAFSVNKFASFFPLSNKKVIRLANRMLHEYREREFFHPPMRHRIKLPWPLSPLIFPNFFHHHTMIMNTEELATLWHFPGQTLRVPALERIESKEASPPTNLPM